MSSFHMAEYLLMFANQNWLSIVFALLVAWLVRMKILHPLRKIPGPEVASVSRWWLLWVTLEGRQHWRYVEAHRKYGSIVRIIPNTVIINDPQFLQANFFEWDKSDWWLAFRISPDHIAHGNELNIKLHQMKKQKIMGGFSLSILLRNERKMDGHIAKMTQHFTRLAVANTVFDLAPWTQYAAFDIVMDMLFSNPPGFLEKGTDVGGIIGSLHGLLTTASIVASFSIIPRLILSSWINPLVAPSSTDTKGPGVIHGLAKSQVDQRLDADGDHHEEKHDVLQWMIDYTDRDGQHTSREMLEKEALDQVFAGSDTTSAAIRVIISLRLHQSAYQIQQADDARLLSVPVIKFEEVKQHIPYIEAIFKEALRIYPIIGTPLYRKVPDPGIEFEGYFLPGGTEVGLSQWAVARNPQVWGSDVDVFRPERWTEEKDVKSSTARRQGNVFFSNGTMMCTGRNLAAIEVQKVIVEIFRNFDVTIINPIQPWKEKDSLIMLHWNFFVRLTQRNKTL